MVLKFIKTQMKVLAIPYEFGEWTQDIVYPYGVGEISEPEPLTEDGKEETTVTLTFFHRGKYIELEEIKEKIKQHFHPVTGLCSATKSGTIVVHYAGAMYIPTGEADLKKLEITLKALEWKGV